MSAHDTPEVGSGETVGEWQGCDFGCTTHDCAVRCDAGSDPSEDVWNERTRHWYCPLGNDNCGAHTPASPDPVQPAGAGEGLSDEARAAKVWHEYAHPTADELADWLLTIPRADLVKMAARFTAWGEHVTYCRAEDYRARADSADAALATALREKAEDL